MRISEHFNLTTPLPFIDVHVDKDNLLFIDPSAIRNGTSVYSRRAHYTLVTFFEHLIDNLQLQSSTSKSLAKKLVSNLHEPNETRLGMSKKKIQGKGFGSALGEKLNEILTINQQAQFVAVHRLEHLPLFIKNVGDDLISDATTQIVYEVLGDFTYDMMQVFPSLKMSSMNFKYQCFNPQTCSWEERTLTLPTVNGKPLLLVPKEWVSKHLLMNAPQFYRRHALEILQREQSSINKRTGKIMKPTKKSLRKQYPDEKRVNLQKTISTMDKTKANLVELYQSEIDAEFAPLQEDQIDKILNS